MRTLVHLGCIVGMLTCTAASVRAQEPPAELPPPTPTTAPLTPPAGSQGPLPMLAPAFGPQPVPWYYDLEACNRCCASAVWLMPVELYIRNGINIVTGGGTFGEGLQSGYLLEVGAKNWCYEDDKSAAWVAELGVDYIYNNNNKGEPIIADFRSVVVRDMSRVYLHIVGGREWYWDYGDEDCKRCIVGLDTGGRLGHAHVKFLDAAHNTDFTKTILIGGYVGCSVPCCGKELIFQGRMEWEHDWLHIADGDNTLEGVNLLLTIGCRF